MSATALATETAFAAGRAHEHSERLSESSGSTLEDETLEDLILGAWEDLSSYGRAGCPVCAGELGAAGCRACGSELS